MDELSPFLPMRTSGRLIRKEHSKPAAYALLHPTTDGVYVGSSGDLYKRIATHYGHLRAGTHSNRGLQAAFNTCPRFDLRFIFVDSVQEAVAIEQGLLDKFGADAKLLNVSSDATCAGRGHVLSEETRSRLSASTKRQFASQEARDRQSEASKRLWTDPAYRQQHIGKTPTEAKKNKISASVAKRWDDPSYREKVLASQAVRRRPVIIDGAIYSCVGEAAIALNIAKSSLDYRLKNPRNKNATYVDQTPGVTDV